MLESNWPGRVLALLEEALREDPDVFWDRVDDEGTRGRPTCWSYGPLRPCYVLGVGRTPAEVAFFLTHDRWPEGLRFSCNNRLCANPDHLEEVSHAAAGAERRHRQRRLTDEEVREVRYLHKEKRWPYRRLADHFDADPDNVERAFWGDGAYQGVE